MEEGVGAEANGLAPMNTALRGLSEQFQNIAERGKENEKFQNTCGNRFGTGIDNADSVYFFVGGC
jgi:hypothetical protein